MQMVAALLLSKHGLFVMHTDTRFIKLRKRVKVAFQFGSVLIKIMFKAGAKVS